MEKNIINGATLLGVSLTLFALRESSPIGKWSWWGMVFCSVIFMMLAFVEFLSKPKT